MNKKIPKGLRPYDNYLIEVFIKQGKELSAIDVNALEKALTRAFEVLVKEFRKRALTNKLRIRLSK